jgi:hypothetical protein
VGSVCLLLFAVFFLVVHEANAAVGISYGGVRFDYSYSMFDLLDDDIINRFSVGMSF